jgi:cell division protein FtsX
MAGWVERQRNILDFTFSSLLRRKRKNIALLAVYTLIVFLLGSVMFLTYSIKREAAIILQDGPEMVVQKISAGRHDSIPLEYIPKIQGVRGVSSVNGRLWGYYYDPVSGANYTLIVPPHSAPDPGTIHIGQGVSRTRLTFSKDTLNFRGFDGKIFPLEVKNPRELSTIALKITELLPDTRIILREELLRTYEAVFSWRGGMLIFILAGAVLAFIILSWDKASGLSQEERKEIGILKAIGWETSDVIFIKFWEGIVVSLSAFFVGIILAYLHVFFASSSLFAPVLKGWAVLYPQFKLVPFIDASQVVALFFLTVVPYTVATIIPSWRAATVDPDSVMRA